MTKGPRHPLEGKGARHDDDELGQSDQVKVPLGTSRPARSKGAAKGASKSPPKIAAKQRVTKRAVRSAGGDKARGSADAAGAKPRRSAPGAKKAGAAAGGKKLGVVARAKFPAARPRRKSRSADQGPPPGKVRIQKVLAEAGVASRRACEQLVLEGHVTVNGKPVKELPCFVEPGADRIAVNGRPLKGRPEKKVYVLLNKPRNVVSTNSDPYGRRRLIDLVPRVEQRLFPVGRLDADSVGLILLTNDGELANRLTHPRYGLDKTDLVEVEGRMEGPAIEQLKGGMYLDGRRTSAAGIKVVQRSNKRTVLEVRVNEGRNREIRRMLAKLEYKVRSVRRVAIGPITDKGIKTGNHRMLTPAEIKQLWNLTDPSKA